MRGRGTRGWGREGVELLRRYEANGQLGAGESKIELVHGEVNWFGDVSEIEMC